MTLRAIASPLTYTAKGCNRVVAAPAGCWSGHPAVPCRRPAVTAGGRVATTVERLGDGDQPRPEQQAFAGPDGFRSGYRTPGQACAVSVLKECATGRPSTHTTDVHPAAGPPTPTADEIGERMSGDV
ncbi:hypothetical protein ACWD4G_06660 [Streptomyces sp. NPDC002643]